MKKTTSLHKNQTSHISFKYSKIPIYLALDIRSIEKIISWKHMLLTGIVLATTAMSF